VTTLSAIMLVQITGGPGIDALKVAQSPGPRGWCEWTV
jgi:hypothetical protein